MCPPGPRSVTSRRIVRTYSGTALGGTTPEASTSSGSGPLTVSTMTMSPELMVSTGLSAALKCPTWTVCGLGISVYSAASALGNTSADKTKPQIDSAPILSIASFPSVLHHVHAVQHFDWGRNLKTPKASFLRQTSA